jgi:tetratricopeptide (TPR) repeat protein
MRIDPPVGETSIAASANVEAVRSLAMSSPLVRLRGRLARARKAFHDGDMETTAKQSAKVIAAADKLGSQLEAVAVSGSAQLLIGHVADATGDTGAAEAAYHRAVDQLTSADEIVWARGDHLADLGIAMLMCQLPGADAPLRRAMELGEDTLIVRRYLGLSLLRDGRLTDAKELLAEVVRRVPSDWRASLGLATIAEKEASANEAAAVWLTAAEAARAAGRLADALDAYRASDRLASSVDAKRGIAASLGQLGRYDEADRAALDVINEDPDDYEARCVHIEALFGLDRPSDAAAAARELIGSDAQDPVPHAYLGIALSAMSEFDDAVAALAHAHQLLPDNSSIRIALARALRASERVDEAIRVLDEGIAQDPSEIDLRLLRAECALDRGDLDAAALQVVAVNALDPEQAPWLQLSRAMGSQNDFDRALSAADQQLVIRPGDAEALGLRGAILVDLDELDEGIAALRASADSDPAADTMGNLARALLLRGANDDYAQAEELARRLLAVEEREPRGAVLLSWALWLSDRSAEAIEVLDGLARRLPLDGDLEGLRTRVLLDLGRMTEALEAAQRAAVLLPDDAEAHSQLGRLYSDLADSDAESAEEYTSSAIEELARAIELDPTDFDTAALLGRLHLERDDYDSAESLLTNAVQLREDAGVEADPAALHALARVQLEKGNAEEALRTTDKVLELEPSRSEALITKGEALHALERYAESVDTFDQALAIDPDNSYVLASLGESYRMLGELEKALRALDAALGHRPDFAWALASRGAASYASGDTDAAASDLEAAIRHAPAYRFALSRYTEVLLELGRVQDAVPAWETAIATAPADAGLRIEYADTLRLVNRPSDGLPHIEQALRDEPNSVLGLRVFGRILLDLGRIDEAAAQFERALTHDSALPEAVMDLAGARERQGRPLSALRTTKDAIDRNPTVDLFLDHGWRLARLAAWHEADACANRALELSPTSVRAYGLRGWVAPMLDRREDAVAAAAEAVRLDPEFVWYRTLFGDALRDVGRTEEAMREYTWVADRADQVADSDVDGLHSLGWALMCLGKHKLASRCLSKAKGRGYDKLSVLFDLGLNSLAAGQVAEGQDTYDEALSVIDRVRSSRHKANSEMALLDRGSIAVAIYDLRTALEGGRVHQSDEIEEVITKLNERLSDLPLPPELTALLPLATQ